MLTIITSKSKWDSVVTAMPYYDFYHTYDYHLLASSLDEKPILCAYKKKGSVIALPLVIRPIKNTPFFDASSVYGYAGPLTNNLDHLDLHDFSTQIKHFFKENKIISVYSSLHPYMENQKLVLQHLGCIQKIGSVVGIHTTLDEQQQLTSYSTNTKRNLKKAEKTCYIKVSSNSTDADIFIDLYYETMKRVKASNFYFFSKDYFKKLIQSKSFSAQFIFAALKETDEIISAGIMVKTNNTMVQYHLSGTKEKYLYLSPLRLILDKMRDLSTKEHYAFLNLGGGLGGKQDSLFSFKSSFSQFTKPFFVWKYIVNEDIYQELCLKNAKHIKEDSSFFPKYRFPNS